ncbi:MAG: zinc ribbon domain-containing protein [Acidobacteriota bacterium]|nr:zinc ribbon domain-containing protein [Acidobacteriota bacterium]
MHIELARLVSRRLIESGETAETPITVAELHRRLVPYPLCRSELGLASKAEYDVALLRMLVEERLAILNDRALVRAAVEELESPEPGLAFLQKFAASELRIGPEAMAHPRTAPDSSSTDTPEPASPGPAPVDMELSVGPDDLIPGLDDLLFRPDGAPDPVDVSDEDDSTEPVATLEAEPASQCWNCRADLPDRPGARFCIACGADQSTPVCDSCGREIERDWAFCAFCGEAARGDDTGRGQN